MQGNLSLLGSRIGGKVARFWRHALSHEIFDLRPNVGIAFALHMIPRNVAIEPGISFAVDWRFLVVEAIVSEDAGF